MQNRPEKADSKHTDQTTFRYLRDANPRENRHNKKEIDMVEHSLRFLDWSEGRARIPWYLRRQNLKWPRQLDGPRRAARSLRWGTEFTTTVSAGSEFMTSKHERHVTEVTCLD
uniref:Uncharacterized protein n=1 Tax=Parascaris univalens TaxID=6257 RepID=A0A915AND0_PARUN